MNFSKLFLSEFEEMISCIHPGETANTGMGLQWLWHHMLVLLLEETRLTERVCKRQFETRVAKHYPMLTLHFAGLRIYNGKSFGTQSEGKEPP